MNYHAIILKDMCDSMQTFILQLYFLTDGQSSEGETESYHYIQVAPL